MRKFYYYNDLSSTIQIDHHYNFNDDGNKNNVDIEIFSIYAHDDYMCVNLLMDIFDNNTNTIRLELYYKLNTNTKTITELLIKYRRRNYLIEGCDVEYSSNSVIVDTLKDIINTKSFIKKYGYKDNIQFLMSMNYIIYAIGLKLKELRIN